MLSNSFFERVKFIPGIIYIVSGYCKVFNFRNLFKAFCNAPGLQLFSGLALLLVSCNACYSFQVDAGCIAVLDNDYWILTISCYILHYRVVISYERMLLTMRPDRYACRQTIVCEAQLPWCLPAWPAMPHCLACYSLA